MTDDIVMPTPPLGNPNQIDASNIDIDTKIENADVSASGSSDIYINDVSGRLIQKESGSADIHIN